MAKLIVIEKDQKKTYNLTRDETTIGRSPDAHVPLRDPRTSRRHARVTREGDEYRVLDEGSQNGTYVNGSIVQSRLLRTGDLVEVGSVRIFFNEEDAQKLAGAGLDGTRTMNLPAVADDDVRQLLAERATLRRLQRIVMAINSTLELENLLGIIVDHAIELAEAERGFLILVQDGELKFEVARNFAKEEVAEPEFHISRTIAEKVVKSGEPLLAVNALEDDRFREIQSISAIGLRSVLCLPFTHRDRVIGVLYIDNRLQKGVFGRDHLRMLESLAAQAATAIEHARLFTALAGREKELTAANERIERLNRALRDRVDRQAVEISRIQGELESKQSQLEHRYNYDNIIGRGPAMQEVFRRLDRIIPTELPVLVEGETGTGKELVARAIHYMGPRKKQKFVSENCAALTETLLESELFGYARGAFTGAAKEKEIRRVGGKETIQVDVRIIAASNRDLRKMVQEGKFREDLFYRLRVLTVTLPPLRTRKEDLPVLVSHFFTAAGERGEGIPERIDPAVLTAMTAYHWPGNVRELENEVRRMVALSDREVLLEVLSEHIRSGTPEPLAADDSEIRPLDVQVRDLEVREIRRSLQATEGNKTKASELLGISRFTLQRKLEKYDIDVPE